MEKISVPAHSVLGARDTVTFDGIRAFFDRYYPMMEEFLSSTGATPQAARSYTLEPPTDSLDMIAAFLIADEDLPMIEPLVGDIGDDKVGLHRFEAGEFLRTRHTGSYDGLAQSWQDFMEEAAKAGYTPGKLAFEDYLDMSGECDLYLSLSSSSM